MTMFEVGDWVIYEDEDFPSQTVVVTSVFSADEGIGYGIRVTNLDATLFVAEDCLRKKKMSKRATSLKFV